MKKKVIAIMLLIVITGLFSGCVNETEESYNNQLDTRFMVMDDSSPGFRFNRIIVDKETGVMYLFHGSSNRGGLTVMVDADGKPLLHATK